jgi:hypothetical protein
VGPAGAAPLAPAGLLRASNGEQAGLIRASNDDACSNGHETSRGQIIRRRAFPVLATIMPIHPLPVPPRPSGSTRQVHELSRARARALFGKNKKKIAIFCKKPTMGIEPMTSALLVLHSATELRRLEDDLVAEIWVYQSTIL